MKACTRTVYGEADVLEISDVERPTPADDEVLVRLRAASNDRGANRNKAAAPTIQTGATTSPRQGAR